MNRTFQIVCIVATLTLLLTSPASAELDQEGLIARDGLKAVGQGLEAIARSSKAISHGLYALGIGVGLAGHFIGRGLGKNKDSQNNDLK